MLSEVFTQLLSDVSKVIRNQSKFYYVGMSNFFIAPVAQYIFQYSNLLDPVASFVELVLIRRSKITIDFCPDQPGRN